MAVPPSPPAARSPVAATPPDPLGPRPGDAAAAAVRPAVPHRVRGDQRHHRLAPRAPPGAARLLQPHGADGRLERSEGQGRPRVHDREHARRGRRQAGRARAGPRDRRPRRPPRHRRERRRELRLADGAQAQPRPRLRALRRRRGAPALRGRGVQAGQGPLDQRAHGAREGPRRDGARGLPRGALRARAPVRSPVGRHAAEREGDHASTT